jgi:MFS family permease
LMNALSLYSIGFNVARILGPSMGGVLVLWIGVGGCYAVFAVGLILSGLALLGMRLTDQRNRGTEQNFIREFKEGFRYISGSPVILSSIVAAYTFSIFVSTYQRFLPVFAKDILNVGPQGLGLLMAAPGLGGIACLTFLAAAGERWKRTTLLWVTTTVTPVFLMLFCASPFFWFSALSLAFIGAGQVSFRTTGRLIIQIEAPRELLGRVMSVFNMDQGMRSIGSIVMGTFATIFGASLGLALTAGVSLIITTGLFYRLLARRG